MGGFLATPEHATQSLKGGTVRLVSCQLVAGGAFFAVGWLPFRILIGLAMLRLPWRRVMSFDWSVDIV